MGEFVEARNFSGDLSTQRPQGLAPATSVNELAETYRKADRRLREVLFGDGTYTMGAVKGEEARSQLARQLRRMREAFTAALQESEEGRAAQAEARVAELEEALAVLKSWARESVPTIAKGDVHVVPSAQGWLVQVEGAGPLARSVHKTQSQARHAGREIARGAKRELLIHGQDGRIRERRTYGEDRGRRAPSPSPATGESAVPSRQGSPAA